MLKITEEDQTRGGHLLRLEGSIAGVWVAELQRACESALSGQRALMLDCASVAFIDHQGVLLVGSLVERGAGLVNCSPYVTERLRPPVGANP